ncbi:CoA-transferase family III, partial [Aureobasidium melanogenum]
MSQSPPLTGLRVLEFAGLAPGPFAGLLLADWGASVLRIDRATPKAHTPNPPAPTSDLLTRHKASIAVDIKSPSGISLILSLIPNVDILIDPFRPGVLEKAGLSPENVLLKLNPRLIVARMTGFRRDGKYASMAGHDINYVAVSGVLSQLGRKGYTPYPPANLLGDFGGGGLDGGYMAVGALEPQFFAQLLKGLGINPSDLSGPREDRNTWPALRRLFTETFKSKSRAEWEKIFDNTDACCTPVLAQDELEESGYDQRPIVTLKESPGKAIAGGDADKRPACQGQGIGVEGNGWESEGLAPGVGGEEVLARWMGWSRGRHYDVVDGGLVRLGTGSKL